MKAFSRCILPLIFSFACATDETFVPDMVPETEIIRIPVVVHVVNYVPQPFEISDEKIRSQIEALNRDFRRKNDDWTKTPPEFLDVVADFGMEFELATTDPDGNATTGIIRTSSTVTGLDGFPNEQNVPVEDLKLYFTDKGGQDAWPNDKFLNIWIADFSDRQGEMAMAGRANLPGSDARIDGVVIDPRAFGTMPPSAPGYELGRTATHEIGHWLGLRHLSGKNGSCEDGEDGDGVDDTPVQETEYTGSPVYPAYSCGSSNMFMNFMNLVSDQSMYMFTEGQKRKARNLFNAGGARRQLYLNLRK